MTDVRAFLTGPRSRRGGPGCSTCANTAAREWVESFVDQVEAAAQDGVDFELPAASEVLEFMRETGVRYTLRVGSFRRHLRECTNGRWSRLCGKA